MTTVLVNIPEKDKQFFLSVLQKFKFKSTVLTDSQKEEIAMARWIEDGLNSKDVSIEKLNKYFRKNGVDC
ncbi:MAG: hypothetical protein J0M08_07765 [Bacteroidetes bacterium]|nr:hypothetical protein [Bacteroidota bacterium]